MKQHTLVKVGMMGMSFKLDKNQIEAIEELSTGSVLHGGVGSGKSRTAIAYYFMKVCGGHPGFNKEEYKPPTKHIKLYIITTARKRDTLEWEEELAPFGLSTNKKLKLSNIDVVIDSWNNIKKYITVKDSFFIFDEQRVVGSGAWVKAFLKIVKNNKWILLTATPGDTWMDYVPLFIANGFYKNRTEFIRRHVVYARYVKFPKIDRFIETKRLEKLRDKILVTLEYENHTTEHYIDIPVLYDRVKYKTLMRDRWNIFKDKPIVNISELCYALRRVINSDRSRQEELLYLFKKHNKIIIFYNFNYELEILKKLCVMNDIEFTEWNGHKHEAIPETETWAYLVQYNSNAEGWNCIETNAMVFYSQNYSYKTMVQAAGRINRRNTPFKNLYYYTFVSTASMDIAIKRALKNKRNFNERSFIK